MAKEKDEITQTDILLQIAQTLADVQTRATQGVDVADALTKMTSTLSELATRARPENPDHNHVSAYFTEADKARYGDHTKKPAFKCDMFWVGYPLDPETQTPEEIEVLNTLVPGEYRVKKANGTEIPFTVEGKRKMSGELESLWIQFPCKGEQSTDHGSMVSYCQQAMGAAIPSLADLQAQLATLRQELQVAHQVIEAA